MSTMAEDQAAARDAAIGFLNGCGLGSVLWAIIIGVWRLLA